ncbi:group II intron maturase-specific domain-containing protein [Streptomyces carpinensis]|uniref:Group II intron maturase-specific domain-containing protein n=1 Tax=Streptomyces carpinensis TaxID=66369 RepID=A0ABV1WC47_9ACTN
MVDAVRSGQEVHPGTVRASASLARRCPSAHAPPRTESPPCLAWSTKSPRSTTVPPQLIVEDVNAFLRGWGAYFRFGTRRSALRAIGATLCPTVPKRWAAARPRPGPAPTRANNHRRRHGETGHITPVESEANHYRVITKPQVTTNI